MGPFETNTIVGGVQEIILFILSLRNLSTDDSKLLDETFCSYATSDKHEEWREKDSL